MKKLIIHIGPHKTGTTSIQRMLLSNLHTPAQAGYAYPDLGLVHFGHHGLVAALDGSDADWNRGTLTASLNAVESNLVLSSENFSRLSAGGIEFLAEHLKADAVRIVCYLRSPVALLPKWWAELVNHRSTSTLPEYLFDCFASPSNHHLMSIDAMLQPWARCFGRDSIDIYSYDGIEDVTQHFVNKVLNVPELQHGERIHQSLSVEATELIRRMNSMGLNGVEIVSQYDELKVVLQSMSSRDHLASVRLDMDMPLLAAMEQQIVNGWSDRLDVAPVDGKVFPIRSAEAPYVKADFWAENPDFSSALTKLLAPLLSKRS